MSSVVVLSVIALYFAAVFLVSHLTTRSSMAETDFYTGGRKSPWWVVAISMIGTSITGVTFISVPGMVQASQFSYLQMALGFIAGYVFIAYVLLPLYYRINLQSIYSYLKDRMGEYSYRTGAAFFLLSKLLVCGVRLYLTAIVLQVVLFSRIGIPFSVNVIISMLLVWLYSFRGGVKTLVWTDMFQTLAMLLALGLSILFVGKELGLESIYGAVAHSELSRIFFFDNPLDRRFFPKQFLAGMFTTIAMTGLDQDMMQKNLSCKTLRAARTNMLCYGASFVPVNLLFLSLGVLLYKYAASVGLTGFKPDELFPTLAVNYLPGAVGVVFVLGLISAAFSSAGSALTALTTTFTLDILKAPQKRKAVHLGSAVLMALVILLFQAIGSRSVIDAVYTITSYTYGPLLGLFLFGIFTKRRPSDKLVPAFCIASPLLCLVLSKNSEQWFGGYQIGFELLLYNAAITLVLLLLTSKAPEERQ